MYNIRSCIVEYTKKAIVNYHTSESAIAHFDQTQNEWDVWYYNELTNGQTNDQFGFLPYNYVSATVAEALLKDMPQVERFIANHQMLVEKIGHPVSVSVVDFDSSTTDFKTTVAYPPIE
jgi:hypothetical protein